jgi:tryptophan halogenase
MQTNLIKNITIVGGGTSAWLAAAYLNYNFPHFNITVVDKEVGSPVGVGEGTLMNFRAFMENCGFEVQDWMPKIDATLKSGILFPGWVDTDREIWHPFLMNPTLRSGHSLHDVWSNLQNLDFKKFGLGMYESSILENKVDKDLNYAYHVDCGKLVLYIQDKLKNKISLIRSEMVEIIRDNKNYIQHLKLKNGETVTGDLFLDCTGFKHLLQILPKRNTLEGRLICDTAIAGHIPYQDRDKELHPYVISEAIDCGWVWNIPVSTRIGSGLVFNRTITSVDEAKEKFLKYWNYRTTEDKLKVIDWTPYYNDNIWHENVVSIGLSAGFIEPLESTGIALIMEGIYQLSKRIQDMSFNDLDTNLYNQVMKTFFEESIDFVSMHYSATNRTEPLWRAVKDNIKMSNKQKFYINLLADPTVPMPTLGKDTNFFSGRNWTTWLVQMGYPVAPRKLNVDALKELNMYYNHIERYRAQNSVLHSLEIDRVQHLSTLNN